MSVTNTDLDIVTHLFIPGVGKPDGTDNDFINLLNDMLLACYTTAADYGTSAAWDGTGSGVDVRTTFPSNPTLARGPFRRINTNGGNDVMRDWSYNPSAAEWQYIEYS